MTPDQAAVIGFANNVAGLVGSFGVGWTVDHYCPTRMKGVALGLSALAVAAYSWFTICLPSAVLPHQKPLLQPSLGMLVAAGSFGGFLQVHTCTRPHVGACACTGLLLTINLVGVCLFVFAWFCVRVGLTPCSTSWRRS